MLHQTAATSSRMGRRCLALACRYLAFPLWRQNQCRDCGWELMPSLHRGKQGASNTFIPDDWSPRMRQLWVEEHRKSHEIYVFRALIMPSQCLFGHSDPHKTERKMVTSARPHASRTDQGWLYIRGHNTTGFSCPIFYTGLCNYKYPTLRPQNPFFWDSHNVHGLSPST